MYFDEHVQDAIIEYNSLDQQTQQSARNKIYQEDIHYAFDKLCENIINTFKFTYFDDGFEDVKHEVVAFLLLNIHYKKSYYLIFNIHKWVIKICKLKCINYIFC